MNISNPMLHVIQVCLAVLFIAAVAFICRLVVVYYRKRKTQD